jgi:hypothetical protein
LVVAVNVAVEENAEKVDDLARQPAQEEGARDKPCLNRIFTSALNIDEYAQLSNSKSKNLDRTLPFNEIKPLKRQ